MVTKYQLYHDNFKKLNIKANTILSSGIIPLRIQKASTRDPWSTKVSRKWEWCTAKIWRFSKKNRQITNFKETIIYVGNKSAQTISRNQNFEPSLRNGILLPIFWPSVRKNCSSAKFLRSLEQFIQTVKGQNNFW